MRALVTGGNGFIGSHLVDALVAGNHQTVVCDLSSRTFDQLPSDVQFIRGSINDKSLVADAVENMDVVFHLSWANVHEVSNRDPADDVRINLIPTIGLLEACCNAGVRRFVFLSSGGTVYGEPTLWPTPETHPTEPRSAYGITKLAVEKYLELFHQLHGLEYVVFRPSVPYGQRQNPHARQGAVAVFMHRVAAGLPITIWGDGSVSRDYFHVSDLVDAMLIGSRHEPSADRIFNIGGSEPISLLELVRQIEQVLGRRAQLEFTAARKFDAGRVWLDTRRAQQALNWRPRVSLQEGLAQTWQWMKETLPAAGGN